MKSEKLKTGQDYPLAELFHSDRRIIIPDLQRDYCWGAIDKNLAHSFVSNLLDNLESTKDPMPLGLIYGYEEIQGHVNLCDGQQRLTTLFLLLGMLNRKCDNKYWGYLMSTQDSPEPFLQYAIRESTLYFINDLCLCFFKFSKDAPSVDVSSIGGQNWYFRDYDIDPSVKSMLATLRSIEEILNKRTNLEIIAEKLLHNVTFHYYDMRTRHNGEETFVLINTTGEPLSVTQNLKPKYLYEQEKTSGIEPRELARKWEEWETWFWQNRIGNGKLQNDTAETGFREFFRWVMLSGITQEEQIIKDPGPSDYKLSLKTEPSKIEEVFSIVHGLFNNERFLGSKKDWLAKENAQVVWLQIIPVVVFIQKNKINLKAIDQEQTRAVVRVIKYFENLARIENISKGIVNALFPAISAMRNLPSTDISGLTIMEGIGKVVLPDEERRKFELLVSHPADRVEMENAFWKAQNNPVWAGEIAPLIKWATLDGEFSLERFKAFANVFENLFTLDCQKADLDPLRRALIAEECLELPKIFTGITNKSFCFFPNEWKQIINIHNEKGDNTVLFGRILSELINQNPSDYARTLDKIACEKARPSSTWYYFATRSELLGYSTKKCIREIDSDVLVVRSFKGTTVNQHILILNEELKAIKSQLAPWNVCLEECSDSYIVLNHKDLWINIEIRPTVKQSWLIKVLPLQLREPFPQRLRENGFEVNLDDGCFHRVCAVNEIRPLVVELCKQIVE